MEQKTKLGYYYNDIFLSMSLKDWSQHIGSILREDTSCYSFDAESTISSIVCVNEYLSEVYDKVDINKLTMAVYNGYIANCKVFNIYNNKDVKYYYYKGLIILNILKNKGCI